VRHVILGGNSDLGFLAGYAVTHRKLAFRKSPYAHQVSVSGAWATAQQSGTLDFDYGAYRENSATRFGLKLFASGIEIIHFYGLGNETKASEDASFHKVEQVEVLVEPVINARIAPRTDLEVAAGAHFTGSDQDAGRLVGQVRPFGSADFGYVRLRGEVAYDSRGRGSGSARGLLAKVGGAYAPGIWGAEAGDFGRVFGALQAQVSAGRRITVVLDAGGETVFGDFPFQEAAYLGGYSTLRGYASQRFAGDSAVYGRATLQLALARFFLLLPNEFGVAFFADTGRVFVDGEESDRWHPGYGGGIWVAPLARGDAAFLMVGVGEDDTRVYFRLGGY
jgi:hypothetical protein